MKFRIVNFTGQNNVTDNKHYKTYQAANKVINAIINDKERIRHWIEISCNGKDWYALA